MLATLPKLADKAFIFGFFIPALLFTFAMLLLFADEPDVGAVVAAMAEKSAFENLTYLVVFVWVISVLLLMLNYHWYRVLEGYSLPNSLAKTMTESERRRYLAARGAIGQMIDRRNAAPAQFSAKDAQMLERSTRRIFQQFGSDRPDYVNSLLPTRFGNAIRAFERYPNDVYKADGVSLWLHLNTVMSKGAAALVADSRSQVDLVVNICLLSLLVSLAALVRAVLRIHAIAADVKAETLAMKLNVYASAFGSIVTQQYGYILIAVIGLVLARLAYLSAVDKVYSWGNAVKMAYDCYLPALAEKMGYTVPTAEPERRAFWLAVAQRLLYRRPTDFERWLEKEPASGAPAFRAPRKPDDDADDDEPEDEDGA